MRMYGLAAAVAAFGIAGAAQAAPAPSINFTQNNFAVTNSSAVISETFNRTGLAAGASKTYTPAADGNLAAPFMQTVAGAVTLFPGSSSAVGAGVNPDGLSDNYVAIGSNGTTGQFGSLTLTFTAVTQFFSFALGSLDNYNSVQVFFSDATSQTFTGLAITGQGPNTAPGATPASFGQSGRVSFNANGGPNFTSVVFSSTQAAFEIDDIAVAAPEPATWGMMILGFGVVGAALRVRRRKATIAFA